MLRLFNSFMPYFTASLIFAFVFLPTAPFVHPMIADAATVSDIQSKINAKNDEIKRLEEEIAAYEQSLTKTASQAKSLQNELSALTLSKKKLETELKVTQANLDKTTATISELAISISDTEDEIEEKQSVISKTLREVREEETMTFVENLLSAKSLGDVSDYLESSEKLNASIENTINSLRKAEEKLSEKKTTQEGKKVELKKLQSNLSGQKKAVLDTTTQKNRLLVDTKSQESTYKKILDEKVRLRAQFEAELFQYESELKIAIDPSKLPSPIKGGILSWPLDNIYITQQFGRTSASGRLYVSGTHNGVDLRATDGTRIKTALSGTVQATGNTDIKAGCYSYGKWVLIKHPNGLSTLYAHLSSISVNDGNTVVTGDIIGYSGRTGYVTGPHLHLSVLATEGVRVMQIPPEKTVNCRGVTIPLGDPKAFLDPLLYLPAQ